MVFVETVPTGDNTKPSASTSTGTATLFENPMGGNFAFASASATRPTKNSAKIEDDDNDKKLDNDDSDRNGDKNNNSKRSKRMKPPPEEGFLPFNVDLFSIRIKHILS